MMRLVRFGIALGVVFAVSIHAEATHKKSNDCNTPCDVTYTEQKCIAYRQKVTEVEEEVTIHKQVTKKHERPIEYKVLEAKSKVEKRKEVYYTCETKPVEVTYKVLEARQFPEKRLVTEYKCETKKVPYKAQVSKTIWVPQEQIVHSCEYRNVEVDCKWIEYQTETTHVKRQWCTYTCVPKTVETTVPVCRKVWVPTCTDGGCGSCCGPRYTCVNHVEMQKVCRTVIERVPQMHEAMVPVTRCVPVEKTGKKLVTKAFPVEKKVIVQVPKCVTEEVTLERCVTEWIPIQKEVVFNVTRCVEVEKKGIRHEAYQVKHEREVDVTVQYCEEVIKKGVEVYYTCESVPEKVKQKKLVCSWEPYETIVKVPVHTAAACDTSCDSGCRKGAFGCGLRARRCR
jgi:hypothetical protein